MLKSDFQYSNPLSNATVLNKGRSSNCGRVAAQFPDVNLFSGEFTLTIFTKMLHDVEALWRYYCMNTQGASAFHFRTPQQRVKAVKFDVCKKAQKLIGYYSNVLHAIAKLMAVFTARRYASKVYAVVICVCVCVCLSHSGIVSKRLNVGSRK